MCIHAVQIRRYTWHLSDSQRKTCLLKAKQVIMDVLDERMLSTKSSYKLTDLHARAIKYHGAFKARCTSEYNFGPDSECIITELNPRGPVHSFTTCTSPFYINEQFQLIAAHQSGVISPSSFILSTFQNRSNMKV